MKKEFTVSKLKDIPGSKANQQIVAYRAGNQLHTQNLSLPKGASVLFDPTLGEMSIKLKLADGDFVVLHDADGLAPKGIIE